MSYALAVELIAALDAFVVGALACVCLIPFLIDRPRTSARSAATRLADVAAVPALE